MLHEQSNLEFFSALRAKQKKNFNMFRFSEALVILPLLFIFTFSLISQKRSSPRVLMVVKKRAQNVFAGGHGALPRGPCIELPVSEESV